MRKVRYRSVGDWFYIGLKNGHIYDVIRYIPSDIRNFYDEIEINVNGENLTYRLYVYGNCYFVDVSEEYRDETINNILE